MSGESFYAACELLNIDLTEGNVAEALNYNPLHCLLCKGSLKDPCSLDCRHVYCLDCVRDRLTNSVDEPSTSSSVRCPICSRCSAGSQIRRDTLMDFFIRSAHERADTCDNCDRAEQPMYFCETCMQPLCVSCKDNTHQARMFATHKIVPLEERTGNCSGFVCQAHQEPYILFCVQTRELKCINCFRSASAEARSHFVDLAVAFENGRDRLEHLSKKMKRFQRDVADCIVMHRALLDDSKASAANERSSIQTFCQQIIERVLQTRDEMLHDLDVQLQEREEHFRSNLCQLVCVLPIVQLYVLMASILSASASRMDFLRHGYTLIARMVSLMSENEDVRPKFTGNISLGHLDRFSQALEEFNLPSSRGSGVFTNASVVVTQTTGCAVGSTARRSGSGDISPASAASSYQYAVRTRLATVRRCKAAAAVTASTPPGLPAAPVIKFTDSFPKLEEGVKALSLHFESIRRRVQQVQLDTTLRRCVVDTHITDNLRTECLEFVDLLTQHLKYLEELHSNYATQWDHDMERVRAQQIAYQCHSAQAMGLLEDSKRIEVILRQLEPFLRSISSAIASIRPERVPAEEATPMDEICSQIAEILTDGDDTERRRMEAIERGEAERKAQQAQTKKEQSSQDKRQILRTRRRLKATNATQCASGAEVDRRKTMPAAAELILSASFVREIDRDRRDADVKKKTPRSARAAVSYSDDNNGSAAHSQLEANPALLDDDCISSTAEYTDDATESCSSSHRQTVGQMSDDDSLSADHVIGADHIVTGEEQCVASDSCLPPPMPAHFLDDAPRLRFDPVDVPSPPGVAETTPLSHSAPTRPKSCIPADVARFADMNDIEAKQRLLASLVEAVPRVDVGPKAYNEEH